MDSINETRNKIEDLRIDLQVGKIFSSLGRVTGLIIDSAQHELPKTPVALPHDEDGITEILKTLREQMGELDEIDDATVNTLLDYLGSPDPTIRDKGVLYIFNDLIQNQVLSKKQMQMAFDRLVSDEMLLAHINEKQNDAVYLRAFTVMLLATFVYIDRAGTSFIDNERKNTLVDQIALYIVLENDTRGYDEKHGWIHAYTHIGNVLDELASDQDLIRADKILLMGIVIEKYRRLKTPLIYGEANRLAVYIADQLLEDDVYQQFLLIELRDWRRSLASTQVRESIAMWNGLFNRQRLLQAMILNPNMARSVVEYLEDSNDFTV